MYVCWAVCKFFPRPLVSPYCHNFQPSIKLWPTILNRNQRWNGFRVKLFLSYFIPQGPISSPECWMWIKICDNRWKFVEIFLIPPRAPIPQSINPTLQSEPGDKILPQRGNNQTTTTRFPHPWWRWWGQWWRWWLLHHQQYNHNQHQVMSI